MVIKASEQRVFAGAQTELVPPVSSGDCTLFPSLEELATEEQKVGRGCTLRHGRGWARRSVAEIAVTCTPTVPIITSVAPPTWLALDPGNIYGTNLQTPAGQCHLGDAATWAACTKKRLQTTNVWTDVQVRIASVDVDVYPATWYVYILNNAGYRNPVGFPVLVEGPV